ncbi:MAG TPA: MFS transporter [Acidimicrobiales bacterium]|nr:MFS transporter [Acidimicrobiales bacterium]
MGLAFAVFGAYWGVFAVVAADVERLVGVSHGAFGVFLSVALLGAAAANSVGGAATERFGTGPVLAAALVAWGGVVAASGASARPVPLAVAVAAAVAVGGLVDVAMNVSANAALAGDPGAFVRFHALFNTGAAVGAAAAGVLAAGGDGWRWAWAVTGVGGVALGGACAGRRLPGGSGADGDRVPLTASLALLRRRRLAVLAAAFAVGAMVEGGIDLWGVLSLRDRFASGLRVGAASIVAAYLIAAAARVLLGPAAARRGAARGVAIGALLAAAGLVVVAVAPWAGVAGLGLVLAAGGISLCWPLLLSHAGAGADRPGATIGAVTAVGYLGFVFGPAVVGAAAAVAGLRGGLLMLAGAALVVAAVPSATARPPAGGSWGRGRRGGRRPAG